MARPPFNLKVSIEYDPAGHWAFDLEEQRFTHTGTVVFMLDRQGLGSREFPFPPAMPIPMRLSLPLPPGVQFVRPPVPPPNLELLPPPLPLPFEIPAPSSSEESDSSEETDSTSSPSTPISSSESTMTLNSTASTATSKRKRMTAREYRSTFHSRSLSFSSISDQNSSKRRRTDPGPSRGPSSPPNNGPS